MCCRSNPIYQKALRILSCVRHNTNKNTIAYDVHYNHTNKQQCPINTYENTYGNHLGRNTKLSFLLVSSKESPFFLRFSKEKLKPSQELLSAKEII